MPRCIGRCDARKSQPPCAKRRDLGQPQGHSIHHDQLRRLALRRWSSAGASLFSNEVTGPSTHCLGVFAFRRLNRSSHRGQGESRRSTRHVAIAPGRLVQRPTSRPCPLDTSCLASANAKSKSSLAPPTPPSLGLSLRSGFTSISFWPCPNLACPFHNLTHAWSLGPKRAKLSKDTHTTECQIPSIVVQSCPKLPPSPLCIPYFHTSHERLSRFSLLTAGSLLLCT